MDLHPWIRLKTVGSPGPFLLQYLPDKRFYVMVPESDGNTDIEREVTES